MSIEPAVGFDIDFTPITMLTATVRDYQRWNRDALQQFDWSPDSQLLAFQNNYQILVAAAPDFAPYEVAQLNGMGVAQPHWGTDNHQIIFVDDGDPYKTLRLIDWTEATISMTFGYPNPQEPNSFIGFGKDISIMEWLDDERIVFSAMRGTDETNQLLVLSVASRQITELSGIGNIFLAPDNTKYVTKRMFYDDLQWHLLSPNNQNLPMTVGSRSHRERWFEGWAYDSERLIYTEWARGTQVLSENSHPTLYLWNIHEATATLLLQDVFGASWSPTEDHVAFYLLGAPQFNVENQLIGSNFAAASMPEPYFGVLDLTNQEILLMQSTDKSFDEEQYHINVWLQTRKPIWSPNGKYIIYWGQNDTLWLAAIKERSIRQLTYDLPIIQVVWSSDSCYLGAGTVKHLYILSFCK